MFIHPPNLKYSANTTPSPRSDKEEVRELASKGGKASGGTQSSSNNDDGDSGNTGGTGKQGFASMDKERVVCPFSVPFHPPLLASSPPPRLVKVLQG